MKAGNAMVAIVAIALLLMAGNAFAGCFNLIMGPTDITYNLDFTNEGPDKRLDASGNPTGHNFVMDGNTYVVPVDTIMEIKPPITQFKNHCVDGYVFYSNPQMRATVYDVMGTMTQTDNIEQGGYAFCESSGGTLCIGSSQPFFIYHFMRPGLHTVKIEHSLINSCNAPEWVTDDEFVVRAINPLIAVNGSQNQTIAFGAQNEIKTSIIWTVKNISDTELQLSDINMNCNIAAEASCKLRGYVSGLKLLPKETAAIMEEITLKSPMTVPLLKKILLDIKYRDTNSLMERAMKSTPVNLTVLFEETTKFSIKLFAKEQKDCVGANDEFGQTGIDDAPKILLSWEWQNIQQNSCDKKANPTDYIYCDPVQFSIELLKKMNSIETLLGSGKKTVDNDVTALTNFKAYLIGDNYNEDFRKDFDQYYIQAGFFNADSFYTQRNFDKYFINPAALEFNPKKIESGLYEISVDINALDGSANLESLFMDSSPNAKITVNFTKIKDPTVKNPLYYLPFNGDIGKYGVDSDGKIERKDYGLKFVGDKIRLDTSGLTSTDSTSGAKQIQAIFSSEFEKTNISNRGMLLNVTKNKINISPNRATPVLAKTTANAMRAELYYLLKKQAQQFDAGKDYESFWTEVASSTPCTDFLENHLFYRRQDAKADESNCTVKAQTKENSYGFEWAGIPATKENAELYLQTIFFTPSKESYFLENSCAETNKMWFYGPNSKAPATSISLDYTKEPTESLQNIIDLVKQGKACVAVSSGELKIWWNAEEISKALDTAKQNIPQNSVCAQTN